MIVLSSKLRQSKQLLLSYEAQLLTHLKLSGKRLGFLLNFNVPVMKQGIKRYSWSKFHHHLVSFVPFVPSCLKNQMSDDQMAPWYKDGLRFQVHRLRRLLHRCARLRVGQQGRDRRTRRARLEWTCRSLNRDTCGLSVCARASKSTPTVTACSSTARRASAASTRPARGNAAPGRSGNRTCARRKPGRTRAQVCPGSGTGPLVQLEQIETQKAAIRI